MFVAVFASPCTHRSGKFFLHFVLIISWNGRTPKPNENGRNEVKSFKLYDKSYKYIDSIEHLGKTLKNEGYLFLNFSDTEEEFYVLRLKGLVYNDVTNRIFIYGDRIVVHPIIEQGLNVIEDEETKESSFEHLDLNALVDILPFKLYMCGQQRYLFNTRFH